MAQSKVLYLGMAYDIISPLLLVPDFDTLYAIDRYDPTYGGLTWTEQKAKILDSLNVPLIVHDEEQANNRWLARFVYNGKMRSLIYYHHRDFGIEWPEEVNAINHVLGIGATVLQDPEGYPSTYEAHNACVRVMLAERCELDATYYASGHSHSHFPFKHTINIAGEETCIAYTKNMEDIPLL